MSLTLLADIATRLRNDCVRETGVITVTASPADSLWLRHPPLTTNLKSGDVDLNRLIRSCYTIDIDEAALVGTWSKACVSFTQGYEAYRSLAHRMRSVVASVPFTEVDGQPAAPLVQFLMAASWQRGRLRLTARSITLHLGGGLDLSVDDQALEWPDRRYRSSALRGLRPADIVNFPLGSRRLTGPKLGALLLHLAGVFPDRVHEFRLLCMVALDLGPAGVSTLTNAFDVVFDDRATREPSLTLAQANTLVERTSTCPVQELTILLRRLCPRNELIRALGPPSAGKEYTEHRRNEHLAALLRMEALEIKKAKAVLGADTGLRRLMQLEQQIGRTE